MSKWKTVKLGELYEVHNGLSKGRKFFGKGYPFLSFTTVFNNFFLPKNLDSLVMSTEKEREACSIKRGDVFVTRTSETMNELGMSSVALKDYPNATFNGFTKRLRPITNEVEPEFIGYFLRSPQFRGKFMAFSTMTTRASLANDQLLSMEIALPEKPTQLRVANILSKYDSLIQNYQLQIKLLEEAAQRLYKEWFLDGSLSSDNELPITDNDIFHFAKCRLDRFSDEKMYLATADVTDTYLNSQGIPTLYDEKPSRAQIQPNINTVWFARMSNSYKIYAFTQTNVQRAKQSIMSSGFAGFTSEYKYFGYVYNTIASKWFDDKKNSYATGATQVSLTNQGLENIKIKIPSKDVIEEYSKITNPILERCNLLKETIFELKEARDRLLPKLMSGEIEV